MPSILPAPVFGTTVATGATELFCDWPDIPFEVLAVLVVGEPAVLVCSEAAGLSTATELELPLVTDAEPVVVSVTVAVPLVLLAKDSPVTTFVIELG